MAELKNLALSLTDEDEVERSGIVNPAHSATDIEKLENSREDEKSQDLKNAASNGDLADTKQLDTDEWRNYVHSLVKSDQAKEPDLNSNIQG